MSQSESPISFLAEAAASLADLETRGPLTVDREDKRWLIRLEGEVGLAQAAQLKALLLEWLASGKALKIDLEHAAEIDTTTLQLVWAAALEAHEQQGIILAVSERAAEVARCAGFDGFPGRIAGE